MGKSSAPSSPDPYATAAAQGQSNIATARATTNLAHSNVITPYGSSMWVPTSSLPNGGFSGGMAGGSGSGLDQGGMFANAPTGTGTNGTATSLKSSAPGVSTDPNMMRPMGFGGWLGSVDIPGTPQMTGSANMLLPNDPLSDKAGIGQGSGNGALNIQGTDQSSTPASSIAMQGGVGNPSSTTLNMGPMPTPGETTNIQSLSPALQEQFDTQNQTAHNLGSGMTSLASQVSANSMNGLNTSGVPGLKSSVDTSGLPSLQSSVGGNIPSLQTSINASGLPQMGSVPNVGSTQDVAQALMDKQTAMLDPRYQQSDAALESQLANQGITQGSHAYDIATQNAARDKAAAYQQAQDASILAAGNEQSRQYNMGLAGAQFQNQSNQQAFTQAQNEGDFANTANQQAFSQGLANAGLSNQANAQGFSQDQTQVGLNNSAHSTALQDAITQYQLPLNQLNAMKSGGQVAQPSFSNTGVPGANVAPTDISGLVNNNYNAQVGNVNAQNAQTGQTEGTIASIAAMAAMYF